MATIRITNISVDPVNIPEFSSIPLEPNQHLDLQFPVGEIDEKYHALEHYSSNEIFFSLTYSAEELASGLTRVMKWMDTSSLHESGEGLTILCWRATMRWDIFSKLLPPSGRGYIMVEQPIDNTQRVITDPPSWDLLGRWMWIGITADPPLLPHPILPPTPPSPRPRPRPRPWPPRPLPPTPPAGVAKMTLPSVSFGVVSTPWSVDSSIEAFILRSKDIDWVVESPWFDTGPFLIELDGGSISRTGDFYMGTVRVLGNQLTLRNGAFLDGQNGGIPDPPTEGLIRVGALANITIELWEGSAFATYALSVRQLPAPTIGVVMDGSSHLDPLACMGAFLAPVLSDQAGQVAYDDTELPNLGLTVQTALDALKGGGGLSTGQTMSTATRTALTPSNALIVFDTDLGQFFGWNPVGSVWVLLG